jgi:methylglutaconyl-CoA hydratase
MTNELISERVGSLLYLTLNRPEKKNALNDALVSAIKDALRAAGSDPDIRAVVIRGAGTDFCSGADLESLRTIAENSYDENLADASSLGEMFEIIRSIDVPVIAAVHGRALGGGCGLATACDIILATDDAVFGYPEVHLGFVPALVAAILRRNLSEKRAFEMLTQGGRFSAVEGFGIGLVNKVFSAGEFETKVREYASVYEGISKSAVTITKRLFYRMDSTDFGKSMGIGAEANAEARMTEDCKKGIAKFLEK